MRHSMGGKVGKNVKFYGGVRIVGNAPGAVWEVGAREQDRFPESKEGK